MLASRLMHDDPRVQSGKGTVWTFGTLGDINGLKFRGVKMEFDPWRWESLESIRLLAEINNYE